MQSKVLFINMKKLLLILMVVTTLVAMATCLFCKKTTCNPVDLVNDNNIIDNNESKNVDCDENICKRLFIK